MKKIKISDLLLNTGQLDGVPKNPRFIRDEKFELLKKSIEEDPEMVELRECIVVPHQGKYVVIAGNMRLRALRELGYKEVCCKVFEGEPKKLRAIATKDNLPYGEWDWDLIGDEWNISELTAWGVEVWEPEADLDYSILDEEDIGEQLQDMASGVKKAIQIEFEPDHYDEAYELVKFWRNQDAYVGKMILDFLKAEKSKI